MDSEVRDTGQLTMRILFIAPQVPFPLVTGGKLRMFHLLRHYAASHDVTLLCLAGSPEEFDSANSLRQWCKEVIAVPASGQPPVRLPRPGPLRWAVKALSPIPHFVRCSRSLELESKLTSLPLHTFDLLHIERLHWVQTFIPFLQRIFGLTVIDLQDIESVTLRRRIPYIASRKRRALARLDLAKLLWFERWVLKRFRFCLVCSEVDRVRLEGKTKGNRILVVPNGVDADRFRPRPEQERALTLLYLGSLDYWPNEDAVLFFARDVWPRIRRDLKGARFLIAGRKPKPAVWELHGRDSIEVLGEVADQTQPLAQCSVLVVPLRVGGGTRLKILEAMAMGKAVVSTSIGCEGLEVVPGRHLLVADAAETFAQQCVRLLLGQELRAELGRNGRLLVEDRYRWDVVLKPLDQLLGPTRTTAEAFAPPAEVAGVRTVT